MKAYKWLNAGAIDPDKEFAWPLPVAGPGDWVKLGGFLGPKSFAVSASDLARTL